MTKRQDLSQLLKVPVTTVGEALVVSRILLPILGEQWLKEH